MDKLTLVTISSTISVPTQDTAQKAFLHYIQHSPMADWAKDDILSCSHRTNPILLYPPLECFPKQEVFPEIQWKALCLCAAYGLHFLARYEKSKRQDLKSYRLSRILMTECQRICGSIFNLEHLFWRTFYHRLAPEHHIKELENSMDQSDEIHYKRLSFFLLPLDMLSLSAKLTGFQYEMLEQSFVSMIRGFYNLGQHPPAAQRKLFKEAFLYTKEISLDKYDQWMSHYANMIIRGQKHLS